MINSFYKNREKILLIFAFMLILLRFTFPGDTVFIADEPAFQARIDQHMADGTFPLTSFRGSSIAIPYGGGAFWFYFPLRFFTGDPQIIALYHIFFVSFGIFLFWLLLRRNFGADAAAWSFLLVASSPILFFFSRHSWDNTLFVPITAILLFILSELHLNAARSKKKEIILHALLGSVAAYGLNIHLMFGPILLALCLVLAWKNFSFYGIKTSRPYLLLAVFLFCLTALVAPYLLEAYRLTRQEAALEQTKFKERWGDLRNLWWLFQRTTVFASVWGSRIYLEQVHHEFFAYSGKFFTFFFRIDLFGWFIKLAAWGSAVYAFFTLFKKGKQPHLLMAFSAFSFLSMLLVFQYLNIPTAPHYFHPIWWFAFLGFAFALTSVNPLLKRILLLACTATILVNISFILQSMRFVHENKGARAMSYSVVLHEQKRAIGDLCRKARLRGLSRVKIDLSNVFLMGFVFDYLPNHMDDCRGLVFEAKRESINANYRFIHPADSTTKADLILEEVR